MEVHFSAWFSRKFQPSDIRYKCSPLVIVPCYRELRQVICLPCYINVILFCDSASPTLSNVDNEEETKLLQSEIWTTLFRGGYMTGKLQRSLSGHHVSDRIVFIFNLSFTVVSSIVGIKVISKVCINHSFEFVPQATTSSPVESSVNSFLHGIISGDDGPMQELIKRLVSVDKWTLQVPIDL